MRRCGCAVSAGNPLIMPGEVVTIDAARALRDKGIADIPIVV